MPNPRGSYTYEFARPAVAADVAIVSLDTEPQVLLIRRGDDPFKGAWALPGGFVDPDETLDAAAARELREETGLKDLKLEQFGAFGEPGRDPRGWVISIVYVARVNREMLMPKAGDDAGEVKWHPLNDLPKNLAFDHRMILERVRERIKASEV
jgi:8-oxo-dGTP diphosphatase